MKKILFLALHLGFGGAEKAIVSEANMLVERYDVEIACAYKLYDKPAFPLDERVKVTYLSENIKPNKDELKAAIHDKNPVAILKEGIKSVKVLYYRTSKMKKMIRNTDADIIISTRYLYNQLLAKNKIDGVVTIAQEHNHHNNDETYIEKMVKSVQGINYFMPVSRELTEFYKDKVGSTVCKYIPHSLEYIPEMSSPLTEPILVSVGRFSPEKGFVDLVKVFSLVHKKHPEWVLHMIGDGDERVAIEKEILANDLKDSVVLHGYQKKDYINKMLEKASIYVMTSFTESFGIVLIEAQSFGIPCVAYDSARGALEIIKDQENGFLVSNRDSELMSQKIDELIESIELRKEYGANGKENATQYSEANVKQLWFKFIDSI